MRPRREKEKVNPRPSRRDESLAALRRRRPPRHHPPAIHDPARRLHRRKAVAERDPSVGGLGSSDKGDRDRQAGGRRHGLGVERAPRVREPVRRCEGRGCPLMRGVSSWRNAVYTVDNTSAALRTPANKGRESMVYLTYIVDNYGALPDTVLFLHAHRDGEFRAWHVDNEAHDNVESVRALRLDYVAEAGYVNLRCGVSGLFLESFFLPSDLLASSKMHFWSCSVLETNLIDWL